MCVCVCVCQQADAEACSVVCHEKGVCVLPVVSLSVSTGSGMDVCMRGWVGGIFGKRYSKTNDHDAMTQFRWVVLICTVQCSC